MLCGVLSELFYITEGWNPARESIKGERGTALIAGLIKRHTHTHTCIYRHTHIHTHTVT